MYKENSIDIIVSLICTGLVLLLATSIVIIISRYQKKFSEHLRSVEELKIYHENAMLTSQIEIQEQTFQNIAREIHDNVGQKLSLAKLYLVNFKNNNVPLSQIDDSVTIIELALSDLRDMSRTMSSDLILQNGFKNALETEIQHLNKTKLFEIKLSMTGEVIFLDGRRELILFRIVQEVLHNVLKHAKAFIIEINLLYDDKNLFLTIHDDGKGFNWQETSGKGQGLINIKKRTELLGGEFSIESNQQTGTNFKLKIPINV